MAKLTPKQERFCLAYMETGNASEAYRRAYDAGAMKAATISRNAKALLHNNKIATRLEQLRAKAAKTTETTVSDLLHELEEARRAGQLHGQSSTMVSATMGKAKLLGFDDPKPPPPTEVNLNVRRIG